jgi:serine/threonine-protein kinase
VRFRVDLPPGFQPVLSDAQGPDLAISRDGSTIAFPATDDQTVRRIYVRRLDEAAARALPGTEEGYLPTFSPDGTSIAFWAAGRVQRVSVGGGAPQVVGEYGNVISLAWAGSDELLIGRVLMGPLLRIDVTGGEARPAAPVDSAHGETGQLYPVVLSDGRHVLYESWGRGAAEDAHIGVLDLSAGRARRLDLTGTAPLGMLDGRLIYTDQTGTILAVPLDLESGDVEGQPVPVGDGVATAARGTGVAVLSSTGTLAYQGGSLDATLVLADPSGQQVPVLPDARPYRFPRYSPDGTRIAVAIASGSSSDIWVADVAPGSVVRLTTGGTTNDRPEWTPDGSHLLFRAVRDSRSAIWWQPADRSAPATPLLEDDDAQYFEGVLTPDGRSLVYQIDTAQADVMVKELPDGTPRPIADTQASEDQARISPDGRWVALVSAESGVPQVVALPLSGAGAPVQVSLRGGREPVWSRDGRSLFYRAEGKFRMAQVSPSPTFHVVSRGDFMDDVFMPSLAPHANYDVAPDGKKLLVLKGEPPQLLVVHNWAEEARARLEGGKGR